MASSRWVRWVFGSALGLIAAAIVLGIVTFRYGLDAYRGEIERRVEQATGRPFHLHGRLELRLAPLIGVETGPAELDEPRGMSGPPFASWRAASFGLRLRALLHHEVIIDRVRIEGLEVHLRRDANGRTNWRASDTGTAATGASPSAASGIIELDGLEVRDGLIDYDDEATEQRARLSALTLDVGPSRFAGRIEIGATRLTGRIASSLLAGSAGASLGAPPRSLGIPIRLDLAGLKLTPTPLEVIVPGWSLGVADAQARGSLAARESTGAGNGSASWQAHGPISVSVASMRALAETLGIGMPTTADPRAFGSLQLTGEASLANGALAIQSLRARLDDTTLSGRIARDPAPVQRTTSHTVGSVPRIEVDLRGDRVDLGRYLPSPQTPRKPLQLPVAALRALRLEGSIAFDEARYGDVEMKNVRLAIPPASTPGTARQSRP